MDYSWQDFSWKIYYLQISFFKKKLVKVVKFFKTNQLNWRNKTVLSIVAPRITFFENGFKR